MHKQIHQKSSLIFSKPLWYSRFPKGFFIDFCETSLNNRLIIQLQNLHWPPQRILPKQQPNIIKITLKLWFKHLNLQNLPKSFKSLLTIMPKSFHIPSQNLHNPSLILPDIEWSSKNNANHAKVRPSNIRNLYLRWKTPKKNCRGRQDFYRFGPAGQLKLFATFLFLFKFSYCFLVLRFILNNRKCKFFCRFLAKQDRNQKEPKTTLGCIRESRS